MPEFVSESIVPRGGFDRKAMGRGEPGLPAAFLWRSRIYRVAERISQWKHSSREGSHAQGELYLRRHYYQLRMSDGSLWTVYFVRQTPKSGSRKTRWFLYTIDEPATNG